MPAPACENCGAELLGRFCHSCGAPQVSERDLSIRRFAGDATQEITSVEHSKLLRTLRALLSRPGFLTREYFSARRVRYVKPLALVLAILALHLFAFSISNTVSMYDIGRHAAGEEKLVASMGINQSEASKGLLVSSRIQAEASRRRVPAEAIEQEVDDEWARNASLMQIPLILLFSLALQLIHVRSRRYYVEHLVFSMHFISFAALTVVLMWPFYYWFGIELNAATVPILICKYIIDSTWLVVATRTFYGHSLRKSVALGLLTYVLITRHSSRSISWRCLWRFGRLSGHRDEERDRPLPGGGLWGRMSVAQSKQCPKCSGAMSEGFVVDATYGGAAVSSWVKGAPEKSVWTGLKLTGRQRSDIATWRCNRCGFLEHYAAAGPDRKHEGAQRTQALLVVAISLAILLVGLGAVLITP